MLCPVPWLVLAEEWSWLSDRAFSPLHLHLKAVADVNDLHLKSCCQLEQTVSALIDQWSDLVQSNVMGS